MSHKLNVVIVDDDPAIAQLLSNIIQRFYSWGEVVAFTDSDSARHHCLTKENGVAIFVLDVFLEGDTGFGFLDSIIHKFPMAYEDTIIITGSASDDIVNMCIAANIHYLLEKPIKAYALQLAVRAIVDKYIQFAKKLLRDPSLAEILENLS